MIRLKDTRHASTADFLGSAIRIAEYYGFSPLDDMRVSKDKDQRARALAAKAESEILFARKDERAYLSAARRCAAASRTLRQAGNNSSFLAWRVSGQSGVPQQTLELHVVGASNAIAEAILLAVANAIAEESGLS